jgi:hypothetical protein
MQLSLVSQASRQLDGAIIRLILPGNIQFPVLIDLPVPTEPILR